MRRINSGKACYHHHHHHHCHCHEVCRLRLVRLIAVDLKMVLVYHCFGLWKCRRPLGQLWKAVSFHSISICLYRYVTSTIPMFVTFNHSPMLEYCTARDPA
jgi:hypothetical protein